MRFVVFGAVSLIAVISHGILTYLRQAPFEREAVLVVASATFGCLYYGVLFYQIASKNDGLGHFETNKSGILLGLVFLTVWAASAVAAEFLKLVR
jgi:hypothetical protein